MHGQPQPGYAVDFRPPALLENKRTSATNCDFIAAMFSARLCISLPLTEDIFQLRAAKAKPWR
jgi:hypothetical protein